MPKLVILWPILKQSERPVILKTARIFNDHLSIFSRTFFDLFGHCRRSVTPRSKFLLRPQLMERIPFYDDTLLNDCNIADNFMFSCDIDLPRETPLMFRLVFRDDTMLNDSTIYARKLKPRPSHAASSRSLRRSKKYAPKSNTDSKKHAANLSPSTTGKSSWSIPLTPTSASGMMEKTEMCGSPQQPFNHACDLTAHVTFMPVPTNSLFVSSTPPHSCA